MARRRSASRSPSAFCPPDRTQPVRTAVVTPEGVAVFESLERRVLFSTAFDVTQLTQMRADPTFSNIKGTGIGIAVLDTGVFAQNPDLEPNIAAYYDAVEEPSTAPADPNPIQDAVDHDGHGSHVSGIAASSNPAIGVAYGAKLIDIRVFADAGENQLGGDPIVRGLDWVAANAATYNIKVVNMSLGIPSINLNFTPSLDSEGLAIQTLQNMGITVVTASGNSYANDPTPGASIPAVESTISVGNTFSDNGVGQFDFSGYFFGGSPDQFAARQVQAGPDVFNATSQRSTLFNQLIAPGTDIFSTWNSPAQLHNTISGTSMASPFVAGTVALMQQAAQQFGGTYLSPTQVLQILRNTSDQITDPASSPNVRAPILPTGGLGPDQPLPGTGLTYDRVNVYRAIQQVKAFVQGTVTPGTSLHNSIATAIALTPLNGANSVFTTSSIGHDGTIQIGTTDVDLYNVQLNAIGSLVISTSAVPGGIPFDATLRLFDSSGNQLATLTGSNGNYPTISTAANAPLAVGTYYVGVSASGNNTYNPVNAAGLLAGASQGDYQLQVTLQNPDPHGIPAAGVPLDLSSPTTLTPLNSLGNFPTTEVTGTIGLETAPDGSTVAFADGDVQFYTVVAPDNGNIIIQANADVRVFDSNNNAVGSEGSNLVIPVTAGGVYSIGVTTQANAGFNPTNPLTRAVGSTPPTAYDMFIAFTNGNQIGTAEQATPAALGTTISDQIGKDFGSAILGANGGNKDVHFYAFSSPSAGVFDVSATGVGGFVPEMSLWTSTSGLAGVKRLADASETNPHLFEQVTAGQTVLVAITGKGNQNFNGTAQGSGAGGQLGSFSLTTALDPLSILPTLSHTSINNNPIPLTLNQTVAGNIGRQGNLVLGPGAVDFYSFTAPTTAEYQFATDTSQDGSAQTVLRVFDATGRQIAVNQSASATSTNSVVSVAMTAGQTYYIGVSGVGPTAFTYSPLTGAGTSAGSTGPYTLTATDVGAFQRIISFQQGSKTSFTDSHGNKVTVTLKGPGNGQLLFLSPTDGADLSQLIINGTDATSTLTLKGTTSLVNITGNGTLKAFIAPTDSLTGTFNLAGGLGQLKVGSATGASLSIGSGLKLVAQIGQVSNTSLASSEPITSIRTAQWTDTGATRFALTAPTIQTITVPGVFNVDVSTGTIARLSVGTLQSSNVNATTSIAAVLAGSVQGSEIFAGVQAGLLTLPAAVSDFSNQNAIIKSVNVKGAFSGSQIAAWNVTNVMLRNVTTSNGGTPFGIAADNVNDKANVYRVTPAGGKPQVYHNLFAPLSPIIIGGDAVIRMIG
jgi:subtilisin family serine protease